MKEESFALKSGDRVMIYTDGVTEAANPAGEQFGDQRVLDVMAHCSGRTSQDFLVQLVAAIDGHSQSGGVQGDDVTVVTFRVL
jgi:sigma-B regulation protein RsbU (phosphoserine phosphatase)